jgi:hypothetical protein
LKLKQLKTGQTSTLVEGSGKFGKEKLMKRFGHKAENGKKTKYLQKKK